MFRTMFAPPLFLITIITIALNSVNGDINDAQNSLPISSHGNLDSTFGLSGIANKVNSMRTTWTAGENFHPETPEAYLKTLAGTIIDTQIDWSTIEQDNGYCDEIDRLPKEFDARKKWHYCPSVKTIYDQGNCGSCWAVAAASTLSDRLCIQTKGNFTAKLSVQALSSCCRVCSAGNGCKGGWPLLAWEFFQRHGLITGGTYDSNEGCQPYLHSPCDHHVDRPTLPDCSKSPTEKAPQCKLSCYNSNYKTAWKNDLHKVKKIKHISPCNAMKEIYHHGPVQASFTVYEDFYTYKSGIYQYVTGKRISGHSVRVIGWGEEKGIPYWLVANSWNEHWGDNGTFKMVRGRNECSFDDQMIAGSAKL